MKNSESYLIFGGTGSLGRTLVAHLVQKKKPVFVFSRDEEKHRAVRLAHPTVRSIIGDIRDYRSVLHALDVARPRYVINAAAMKQIPLCEEFPYDAVLTNTVGTQNLVHALLEHQRALPRLMSVVSISTDKACKPVNAYGMTKALQERIHLQANRPGHTVHTCVRYGNVLNSTGSVIPVFQEMIRRGEPIRITDPAMTRFLLSVEEAVGLIMSALKDTDGGKIFVPKVASARIGDLADCLIAGSRKIKKIIVGARPGEKIHELLISEEELPRTEARKNMFVIHSVESGRRFGDLSEEYSSHKQCLSRPALETFLRERRVV